MAATVRDPGPGREHLGRALELIASGRAATLAVLRLADVAGSARELLATIDWLERAGAGLYALDLPLDTAAAGSVGAVALLREVERWRREPPAGGPRPGRPGLAAAAPHLRERIRSLRGEGLSLQAIADALDREGVPTPRGGAHWRPSSVQAALGYRRPPRGPAPPPPPSPGAHPPGPPGHPGRAGPGRRKGGG